MKKCEYCNKKIEGKIQRNTRYHKICYYENKGGNQNA